MIVPVSVTVISHCTNEVRRWSVKELAEHTVIFGSQVLRILRRDLKMHKTAAKWVPHHLNEAQQWMRCETRRINLERLRCEGGQRVKSDNCGR